MELELQSVATQSLDLRVQYRLVSDMQISAWNKFLMLLSLVAFASAGGSDTALSQSGGPPPQDLQWSAPNAGTSNGSEVLVYDHSSGSSDYQLWIKRSTEEIAQYVVKNGAGNLISEGEIPKSPNSIGVTVGAGNKLFVYDPGENPAENTSPSGFWNAL